MMNVESPSQRLEHRSPEGGASNGSGDPRSCGRDSLNGVATGSFSFAHHQQYLLADSNPSSPSLRLDSPGFATRRELEDLHGRFSRELMRMKNHGEKNIQLLIQTLEEKVGNLETKCPKLEWQLTDLSGSLKGLNHELQKIRCHSESVEAAVYKLKKHFDEQRVGLQQDCHELMTRVLQDCSHQRLSLENAVSNPPADTAMQEHFDAIAEELRCEIAAVAESCGQKPSHHSIRQELTGAMELLRQDLRRELREITEKELGGKHAWETHRELEELREELCQLKVREGMLQNVSRTEVEQLVERVLEGLRQKRPSDTDLQSDVAKLEESNLELTKKVAHQLNELAAMQDRSREVAREVAREFAHEAEQRCEAIESIFLQNTAAVHTTVDSIAQTAQSAHKKLDEVDQLHGSVALLQHECTRLREAWMKSLEPQADIHQIHNVVAELRGQFDSLGPRLAAVDRHLVGLAECRAALDDLKTKLFCLCGSAFIPDAEVCHKCGMKRMEYGMPASRLFGASVPSSPPQSFRQPDFDTRHSDTYVAVLAATAKESVAGLRRMSKEALQQDAHKLSTSNLMSVSSQSECIESNDGFDKSSLFAEVNSVDANTDHGQEPAHAVTYGSLAVPPAAEDHPPERETVFQANMEARCVRRPSFESLPDEEDAARDVIERT